MERTREGLVQIAWLCALSALMPLACAFVPPLLCTEMAGRGSAVAVALEVREQPGMSAAEALARVLTRRQLLMVLDNCEHVIGAAAQLCAGLLRAPESAAAGNAAG